MNKRGTAAVLAMIFLVVFGALAVGFYAMVSTSVKVAGNDQKAQRAQAAAESGAALLKQAVSTLKLSETDVVGSTAKEQFCDRLHTLLKTWFNNPGISYDKNVTLEIPSRYLDSSNSKSFSAILVAYSDASLPMPALSVTITGKDEPSGITRAISMHLKPVMLNFFNSDVKSKGRIRLDKAKTDIIGVWADGLKHPELPDPGSIMSAYGWATEADPAITLSGGQIDGNVAVISDPQTAFKASGGTVNGVAASSWTEALAGHVVQVDPPDFPEFTYSNSDFPALTQITDKDQLKTTTTNLYITKDIDFTGNLVLNGVIRVAPGVKITVTGNTTINGAIVCDEGAAASLIFKGDAKFNQSSAVPAIFQGYSILGPNSYVFVGGNAGDDNKKDQSYFAGTVVCGRLEESGSGMVSIYNGTLMTLWAGDKDAIYCQLEGDGVKIVRTTDYKPPTTGFKKKYVWLGDTSSYSEPQSASDGN